MRRPATFIPLLLILGLLLTALPAAARAPIAIGISDPTGSGPDLAAVQVAVEAQRARYGRYPALWSLWSRWGQRGGSADCVKGLGTCEFPSAAVKWLHSKGITPVVWWIPTEPGNWEAGKYERYKRIVNGKHDAYIKKWAKDLRNASKVRGKKVIVRFAHESLGTWFPWSITHFDNNAKNFKLAWRHLVKKFRGVGAMKYARFMWSQTYPYKWGYPGDKWVQYVGVTVLNWGLHDGKDQWRDAAGAADKVARATKFTKRPVVYAETASAYLGGDKAQWITNLYKRSYNKHKRVKIILYLDAHPPGHPDWRLINPSDGSALEAYKKLSNDPRFKGKIK